MKISDRVNYEWIRVLTRTVTRVPPPVIVTMVFRIRAVFARISYRVMLHWTTLGGSCSLIFRFCSYAKASLPPPLLLPLSQRQATPLSTRFSPSSPQSSFSDPPASSCPHLFPVASTNTSIADFYNQVTRLGDDLPIRRMLQHSSFRKLPRDPNLH